MNTPEEVEQQETSSRTGAGLRLAIMVALAVIVIVGALYRLAPSSKNTSANVADAAQRPTLGIERESPEPSGLVVQSSPTPGPTPVPTPVLAASLVETQQNATIGAVKVKQPTSIETTSRPAPVCVVPSDEPDRLPERDSIAFYRDTFENRRPEWQPLSGQWATKDNAFVQRDADGYDLIAEFNLVPPAQSRVSVDVRAMGGSLGAGLLVAQPNQGMRNGATLIDFTDGGKFVRWGSYLADTGQYQYIGGAAMPSSFDPNASHGLAVELTSDRTVVLVDGAQVGAFEALPPGRLGLVSSLSSVAFDNFVVEEMSDADQ